MPAKMLGEWRVLVERSDPRVVVFQLLQLELDLTVGVLLFFCEDDCHRLGEGVRVLRGHEVVLFIDVVVLRALGDLFAQNLHVLGVDLIVFETKLLPQQVVLVEVLRQRGCSLLARLELEELFHCEWRILENLVDPHHDLVEARRLLVGQLQPTLDVLDLLVELGQRHDVLQEGEALVVDVFVVQTVELPGPAVTTAYICWLGKSFSASSLYLLR